MRNERNYSAPFTLFSRNAFSLRSFLRCITVMSALSVLASCGDSTQVETNSNGGTGSSAPKYLGPAPLTDEVQTFKTEFWDKLSANDRCGQCHTTGGQAADFAFVDLLDINTAFAQATSTNNQGQLLVDRSDPTNSRVILRVNEGHNCWEGNPDSVCATIVEGYINNWLSGTSGTGGRGIDLTAPPIFAPGESRNFPATAVDNDPNSFEKTVYPVLTDNCAECHSDTSETPQSPFFSSADVDAAYAAAKSKIDLDTPVNSRFVTRIVELHNCWTAVCQNDADEMQAAIEAFAGAIPLTQLDPALVTSKAMTLINATLASGGNRYENDQIALWEFKTGEGNEAFDTSGVEPAMKLTFNGPVSWVLGYGLDFSGGGKAQASTETSKKLTDLIGLNNEYSIEAWVIPGNVTQEDARIISYSAGDTARNFSMSQTLYNYEFLNRSSNTDAEGRESLLTNDDDEDLQSALQHVVITFDPVNGRRMYVNGVFTDDVDSTDSQGGTLIDWNDTYAFVLGNEVSGDANAWSGKLRLVAVHNRALNQDQITQNFNIGVGQKYFMLFSVDELLGLTDSYVMFKVEQFDNTAYLFEEPVFISLDDTYTPAANIPLEGLRIGVNGREAVSGQMFGHLDVDINATDYTVDGQALSRLGTVIAVEKGPESDEFFLTFERFGSNTNTRVEVEPTPPAAAPDAALVSEIGVRTFDEINTNMSFVTGIPVANPTVTATFSSYKQQLPAVENIKAFLASHQMGVAQLAMSYCNELVSIDKALPVNDANRIFKGFDFTQTALNAFTPTSKNQLIEPLLVRLMNLDLVTPANNLATQPTDAEIKDLLGSTATQDLQDKLADASDDYQSLITTMTQCAGACDTIGRTEEIVIATCAATLGSALVILQ
ncbi:MAG: ATPase [endosymbiont of Galathealinum brachiosum]|uniref:ATPase n=1 Tax=endosymbiont of Galathealinum brachiosum TaxID=2200906 RepID=A0A370DFG7_9GAMM|nr:MAG: ATPase [endosymbiont of Galathealinum brachiosum]